MLVTERERKKAVDEQDEEHYFMPPWSGTSQLEPNFQVRKTMA